MGAPIIEDLRKFLMVNLFTLDFVLMNRRFTCFDLLGANRKVDSKGPARRSALSDGENLSKLGECLRSLGFFDAIVDALVEVVDMLDGGSNAE